jgi:hypothetical protein
MTKLEDLKPGMSLVRLEPSVVATVAAVVPIRKGSVQVFYRAPDCTTKERLLGRADEESISAANRALAEGTTGPEITQGHFQRSGKGQE